MLRAKFMTMTAGLATAVLLSLAYAETPGQPGKFYIVGMGTAPDLITLRGADTIKKADIILLNDEAGKEEYKDCIGTKEVWVAPRILTLYMGIDPATIPDPTMRKLAEEHGRQRQGLIDRIAAAVRAGKTVVSLDGGDAMMYGVSYFLELLPKDVASEVVPGVGALQAASAAVKMNPPYGWDTNSVIVTMADWPGRVDTNEKLMATGTSMIFFTMHLDYPQLIAQLQRHYPADTPVAVVSFAGDRQKERVLRSTVGKFMQEIDLKQVPIDRHMLLVGKFLTCGQARKDGLEAGRCLIESLQLQKEMKQSQGGLGGAAITAPAP